jgi:hypothetical protein
LSAPRRSVFVVKIPALEQGQRPVISARLILDAWLCVVTLSRDLAISAVWRSWPQKNKVAVDP